MDHQPCAFAEVWRRAVAAGPDRSFMLFAAQGGITARWSYGEFDELVDAAAARLAADGVGHGNAVHLALTNSPSFVAVWLAAVRLGAWIVPSDPTSAWRELAEHMTRTAPVVGFCAADRADVYRAAAAEAGLASVIDVDEGDATLPWAHHGQRPTNAVPPAPRDRAAVVFTSGTTGRPKGVEITQANYAFAGAVMAAAADLGPDDRQLVVLPLFHVNAQYYSFASAIWVGASVALMPAFSAGGFLRQAADHGATCASLFAGPMRMILARGGPLGPDDPPLRLRHCWFAQNLTADQYETLAGWMGCRPRQLYGMTETIPAVLVDERADPKHDTMGYVAEGCVVDVQDAAGISCGPGDIGEVVVGGEPGLTLFAGYLDDPTTTAASFRDGWFLTGDRARRDDHGRYRFDGRRSDVLKVAGENVSVVEVEAVLSEHPSVLEAAVVGMPDPTRDEVPVAFVVAMAGVATGDVDRSELRADLERWCAERLAKSKRPRSFTFVDELPRTSVGKIRKFELKDAARS